MGKVTLQTIADAVGVSRMTVSNAFSRPDQLSAELRQRILATAADLGYAGPDPAARGLARGRTGTIGVLLTDSLAYAFENEIAARFVAAIATELEANGLAITLLTSTDSGSRIPARDVPMDGALVYSCDPTSTAVELLIKRRLPLVLIDQAPRPGYDRVTIDDRHGAGLAARHLLDLGHRRIGIITYSPGVDTRIVTDPLATAASPVSRERLLGWIDALDRAGADRVVVESSQPAERAGREGAAMLLDLDEPPTALLCFSDLTAYGAVETLQGAGLDVPGDISVVGFDGTNLASRMRPTLTTVRQDVEAKGKEAAAAVLRRIEHPDVEPVTVRLPVELVSGGSTAAR